jgi:crotonobetainyl-CoA:carnitine CoA-transferase CaiB-like acyl-CoA transferase
VPTLTNSSRAEQPARGGALEGICVVELAQGLAGPCCGKLFADYGADVVKVEPPGRGDYTRSWGPFPGDRPDIEQSGLFFFLNTNKRSVAPDVNAPAGRERLLDLVGEADVLIDSSRPQQLRERGLDYDTLARLKRRLPSAHRQGHGVRLSGPNLHVQGRLGLHHRLGDPSMEGALPRDGQSRLGHARAFP